jgi:peptide-methionine (R)-S-oxide reductase
MSTKIEKSDAEWQKELDPLQHHVLRNHGTERPFTSPLNNEKRKGIFRCAGCGEPLFDSSTKYESGSGWPSFWAPMSGAAVDTTSDASHGMIRTRSPAPNAAAISATSSPTARSRPATAIA